MRKVLLLTALLLFVSTLAAAQTAKPAAKPKPATPAASAAPAAPPATPPALPTPDEVEAYFKRMFGYNQELTFKVASVEPSQIPNMAEVTLVMATPKGQQISRWYVSADQKWIVTGDVFPYGKDPFQAAREELQKRAFGPVKGPADATFTMVEFADLECPACAKSFPSMERLQKDYPDVRFIYQSFPLINIHPWAMAAASFLDCVQRAHNDQSWTFLAAVFAHQAEIDLVVLQADGKVNEGAVIERLKHYATMAGADADKISACAATPETLARVQKSVELSRDMRINGTPTLFLNGRELSQFANAPYDTLKSIVDFEISHSGK